MNRFVFGTPDGGPTLAADGGPAGLADPATVSGLRLDKYLVTVGRFRQYVSYLWALRGRHPRTAAAFIRT